MQHFVSYFQAHPIFTISAIFIVFAFCVLWGLVIAMVAKSNRADSEYWERVYHYIMPREQWLKFYHKKQWKKEYKNKK